MVAPSRLLAALLCGLLVTGCNGTRADAVTVHVHLDAAIVAARPEVPPGADRDAGIAVAGVPEPGAVHPRPPAPLQHPAGSPPEVGRPSSGHSVGSGNVNISGGRDLGLVLVAVVAVVLVAVVAWKVGAAVTTAVTTPHAASPPVTYALMLGDGSQSEQLLQLRDGHAIRLEPALVDALTHGGFGRATLQQTGSTEALAVQVVLDGNVLRVRPLGVER